MHIRARGELADHPPPCGEDLVTLAGIGAETDRAADMVEDDLGRGKGARQIDQLIELGVIHPRVKSETERRQPGKAFAYPRVHQ